ncbi:MAG: methyltransferase domain-containing protein [Candidatus Bilamarchaeaceae archaeon]
MALVPLIGKKPNKQLKRTISEIKEFDEKSWRIFKGTGLQLRPGSITKVASQAYPNWGFEITKENKEELKALAESFYEKDLREKEEEGKSVDENKISIQPYSVYITAATRVVASLITNIIQTLAKARKKKECVFKVCELGTKHGALTVVTSSALWGVNKRLLQQTQFYLVDPSRKQLEKAKDNLLFYGLNEIEKTGSGGFSLEHKRDEVFFSTREKNEFDVIVSFFHCHNKPFTDHLEGIYNALKQNGVFIIADVYSPMWQHPVFVYELLRDMEAGEKILEEFKEYFSMDVDYGERIELTKKEYKSLRDHRWYWLSVLKEIREGGYRKEKPIFFLEAHETLAQRIKKLRDNKFSIENKEVSRFYQNLLGEGRLAISTNPYYVKYNSEFITVMAAVKKEGE